MLAPAGQHTPAVLPRCRGTSCCRYGTLEELMEVVTWLQLGHHDKAVGVLNVNGFFDHLLSFLANCESEVRIPPTTSPRTLQSPGHLPLPLHHRTSQRGDMHVWHACRDSYAQQARTCFRCTQTQQRSSTACAYSTAPAVTSCWGHRPYQRPRRGREQPLQAYLLSGAKR